MFHPSQKQLDALVAACLLVLPTASFAQDSQNDRMQELSPSSSQSAETRLRDADQDWSDPSRQDRPKRREQRQFDRAVRGYVLEDEREWAENSSDQDDDEAGLGVTLYERASGREGATIRRVHPNSPAEHMGLRPGDRITKINGDEVESYRDLIHEVRDLEPGDNVRIEIQRDGEAKTVRGELESRREALVFRGQGQRDRGQFFNRRVGDDRWNQERDRVAFYRDPPSYRDHRSYGDQSSRRQFSYEGGSSEGAQHLHVHQQLDSLERQVNQLRREIDQLRNSMGGRESGRTQGYTSNQDQSRNYDREAQAGYSDSGVPQQYGSRTSYDEVDSPGGLVGEERLRPSSDLND